MWSMKGQNFVEHLAELSIWTFARLLDFKVVPQTGGGRIWFVQVCVCHGAVQTGL